MKNRLKRDIIVIAILVVIDMLVKIIIGALFMEEKVMFFDGLFGFKPHLNTTQLSIFNNELGMNVSTGALILLNIIILPIIPLSIRWLKKDGLGDSVFLIQDFLMAGSICSLLDKIFWGGSLDYIYLFNRWIADLKDVYMAITIPIAIYCAIEYEMRKHKNIS